MCVADFVGFDEPDNSRRHNGQLIVIMKTCGMKRTYVIVYR